MFVVKSFWDAGDHTSATMGIVFMVLSMSVVFIGTLVNILVLIGMKCSDDDDGVKSAWGFLKRAIPSAILTPVNLHTLYLGAAYAHVKSKLKVVQAGLTGQVELWRAYDAALEIEKFCYQNRDLAGMKRAEKMVEDARKALKEDRATQAYFEVYDDAGRTYSLFVASKAIETAFESVPLSMLTASAMFMPGESSGFTGNEGLFYSSLALSILSMTYGFFGMCCGMHTFWARSDNDMDYDNVRARPLTARAPARD